MTNKEKFKEWAKDKMFYSTHSDFIKPEIFEFMDINIDCRDTVKSINEVYLSVCDDYEWRCNKRGITRTQK